MKIGDTVQRWRLKGWRGLALAITVVLVTVVACQIVAGRRMAPVTSARVTRGPIEQTIAATGRLEPLRVISVGAETSGQIAKVYVDVGNRVRRGQTLAEIDPARAEASYRQAQAQVAVALATVQQASSSVGRAEVQAMDARRVQRRAQTLRDQGVVAARGLEAADVAARAAEADLEGARSLVSVRRAELSRAQAVLSDARTTLARSRIVAPIDGVVVRRSAEPGQTLASTFQAPLLFEIADDPSKLRLLLDVHEADVGLVAAGQPVRFRVQSYPERAFHGRVARVAPQGRTLEGAVVFPVVVDVENRDGSLKPSMTVEADLVIKRYDNALQVPAQALAYAPASTALQQMPYVKSFSIRPSGSGGTRIERTRTVERSGEGRRVWRLDPSARSGIAAVAIRTGIEGDGRVQVLAGDLQAGERVAIADAKK